MSTDSSQTLPDYRRPPVVEVAAGVFFTAPREFLIPHFGMFWDRIRSEFPDAQHAVPLLRNITASQASIELGAEDSLALLPRIWFTGSSGEALLQLQRDAFFYNWRRLFDGTEYPHYNKVFADFQKYYGIYLDFLKGMRIPPPPVNQVELTYINHIPQADLWSDYRDIGKVFQDFQWLNPEARFLPVPSGVSHTLTFPIHHSPATLRVTLQSATRSPDQKRILRLDMSVRYPLGKDNSDIVSAFNTAHEWIVQGFADLTAEDAQLTSWGRYR